MEGKSREMRWKDIDNPSKLRVCRARVERESKVKYLMQVISLATQSSIASVEMHEGPWMVADGVTSPCCSAPSDER